jgi:heme a synthase
MKRCRHRTAAATAAHRVESRSRIARSEFATGSDMSGGGTSVAHVTAGMAQRSASGLHCFAVATAGATFVLLFLGGLVTSTGSGLAVPDWPLSFGQVFPSMVGGVLFEHGHRLAATAVGCLTVVLALWTVVGDARASVRALGLLALLAVVLQGVLGGITVLYKLPLAVSVTHACLAQTFFCLTVTLALVTSHAWSVPRPRRSPVALGVLAGLTTGAVFGQLVLGALMRHMHAGLAIPDFPLAFGLVVPPLVTSAITVHFAHRVGALVVAVAVGSTAVHVLRHTDDPWIRRPALLAAGLVVLQVTVGALTIWSRRAVPVATTHLVVGAALLATCLVLTLRATRVMPVRARTVDPVGVHREALA